jgi:23S rRNA (adenine2030-N6)-methyltransferase
VHAYRHLFHAGNFADVLKHALLVRLALALARKDKPYLYLETHAGLGIYDLTHPWAQKNREFEAGIVRVWQRDDAPEALRSYLDAVRAANPDGTLRRYPGSPQLVRGLQRQGDRTVLIEMNADDCRALAKSFAHDRGVTVERGDGFRLLKAYLPPPERRALVLIDAAFDAPGELDRLVGALVEAHRRFATGVYALWYPLMPGATAAFAREVVATGIRRILRTELEVRGPRDPATGLRGCGMLVVNPPFGIEEEVRAILGWLAPRLAIDAHGTSRVEWLVPE